MNLTQEIGAEEADNQRNQSLLKDYTKSQISAQYFPYEKPADLKMARNHGKAKKVYKKRPENEDIEYVETCPCCGLPIYGEMIPLNENLRAIYHLGCGYALYFKMVKYSISLLVILFGVGIFNIITNAISHDCDITPDDPTQKVYCIEDYISIFSVANKRNNEYALQVSLILSFVTVVMMILFFHYIRFQVRRTKVSADDKTITPSDYTLKLVGVPKGTSDQEIKAFIEGFATPSQSIKVEKIVRSYEIHNLIKLIKSKEELEQEKLSAHGASTTTLDSKIQDINQQIDQFRSQKIQDLETPVVFVTLETAYQADAILKAVNKSVSKEKVKYFARLVGRKQCKINGQRIKIKRASEPSDVLWENLGISKREKFKRKAFTTVIAVLLIIVSFAIIISISWLQDKFIKDHGQTSSVVKIFSFVSSILLMVINYLIGRAIRTLAEHEKHGTYTGYFTGMATKLNMAQFINAAFTTLIAKIIITTNFNDDKNDFLQQANFYSSGGLMESMFFVFITGAISTPVSTFLDPWYYLKVFQRYRASKDSKEITQKEAHDIFEGVPVDMSYKYSLVIKSILLAAFYAPSLPIIIVFSIIGLALIYWVDKYIFLRRAALPFSLGSELAESMIEYLEWSTFIYALGNLLVVYSLDDHTGALAFRTVPKIWAWLAVVVSLIHIFLPMAAINEKLFDVVDEVTETLPYNKAKSYFLTDYDIENPISHDKALVSSRDERKKLKSARQDKVAIAAVPAEEHKIDVDLEKPASENTFEEFFDSLKSFALDVQAKPMKSKMQNKKPKALKKTQIMKVLNTQEN